MTDHRHAKARRFLTIQPGSETDDRDLTRPGLGQVLRDLIHPRPPKPRVTRRKKEIRGPGPVHR